MRIIHFTLILSALAMAGALGTDVYLPSFPAIADTFAVGRAEVQLTLSVYLFAHGVMALFYGTLSDSLGRRPIILTTLMLFTLGSIGAASAQTFSQLLWARGFQGIAGGAGMVIAQSMIRDRYTGAVAHRMLSNMMMFFGLAPAVAPIIGGYLQVAFGWRANFVFLALFGLCVFTVCMKWLPETLAKSARHPFKLVPIAKNYGKAISNPVFMVRAFSFGCAFGGFALYLSASPDYVLNVLHLPETAFAWLFVPMIGGIIVGSAVSGKLANRVPAPKMIVIGFVVMLVTVAANVLLNFFTVPVVPLAVLPAMLYTFGMALVMPAMALNTLGIFPNNRGLAASLLNFIQLTLFAVISGFVAPLVFGSGLKLALGLAFLLLLSLATWVAGSFMRSSHT